MAIKQKSYGSAKKGKHWVMKDAAAGVWKTTVAASGKQKLGFKPYHISFGAPKKNAPSDKSLAERLIQDVERNAPDVKALAEDYGLKREELGRLTGFSVRALAEWAASKRPSAPAQRRLREVRRLLDALSQIVERDAIPEWLHKRNAAFEGMTPLQVIEVGEIDRLWGMVYEIASGGAE